MRVGPVLGALAVVAFGMSPNVGADHAPTRATLLGTLVLGTAGLGVSDTAYPHTGLGTVWLGIGERLAMDAAVMPFTVAGHRQCPGTQVHLCATLVASFTLDTDGAVVPPRAALLVRGPDGLIAWEGSPATRDSATLELVPNGTYDIIVVGHTGALVPFGIAADAV